MESNRLVPVVAGAAVVVAAIEETSTEKMSR
jgi:hypothetical protein